MSSEEYSYDEQYETDTEDDQVQLKLISRTIEGKKVNERVPPVFVFALNAGRQETINERQLPPYISIQDSKLNFKSKIDGSTALHIAAETGKSNFVKQLLAAGITKSAQDINGNNALIRGVIAGRTNACVYLARKMNKTGIDSQNNLGECAIYIACRRNNLKLLEKLIKYGGNVNIQNNKGITPLMVACFYMNLEMINLLIKAGANIDTVDSDKSNCLHYMAKSKNLNKITNFGAYFDYFRKSVTAAEAADINEKQPLFYALQSECEPLVNFFLNVTSLKDVRLVYNEENTIAKKEVIEVKSNTDEFGYVKDQTQTEDEIKKITSQEREKKWEIMLDEWNKSGKVPRALFHRVYKFVPLNKRKKYWEIELKINQSIQEYNGYFARITELPERGKDDEQIHKDVMRAHQNNIHFMAKFNDGQRTLFRVLRAWSMQDDLGYVQGMSDLCGFLILILQEEEEVYWGFSALMNNPKYNLREMFLPGFPGINKCAFVAMKVMKKYHPKIFYHLKSKEYDFDNWKTYMLEYFMLWFCRCFHPEFEVRILDLILMEGWEIVFSIFSAILHYSKVEILKMDEYIFIDKALADPMTLMGSQFDQDKFINFVKKARITPKEIKKWYNIAGTLHKK
ncbi:Rab GTPase activating protein, putative [Entamoeba histolytica HM-1:IMSS-B]|uniref:Rab GTPase activating protein, putative n=6 Tax=Entamoeba histolytica TaxID=5759 RepID=C4LYV6_ENTH1|nr:Rab GTPase activating protein, putative [Entamoeba histolytica HM-1:IMSS]EMH77830.1 Rab GTPase activating protein, putative [Entamoeba histolytica HM-1:IMSS-B]EMS11927.1 Rab GTPase activating protein, putative [Entamoeba histolytica HM-3:IMSS]ENY60785.1 Rab GTPase activating protein, putative [Entamoeba histolytica HM-1:IMSS-A]GAT94022.1 Rab GTPase activating protein putative [Entamoeba histolytica]EAL47672.1 Rab GTPase activating protein, putative [Entamoeba histolytica HM-1:IMSS]|eukprot:XP_653061.1 Rab GTPase activating protein, putative [Entamoeba histolytica HM-1:IMSS]